MSFVQIVTVQIVTVPAGRLIAAGLITIVLLLTSCASPGVRLNNLAEDHGFSREVVESARFRHVLFRNFEQQQIPTLSVYLEGDGSPWILRYVRMQDPTPRRPVMLNMMALDQEPSLYLGRPCYIGFADAPGCDSSMWTSGRYSTAVVNSMLSVLADQIRKYGVTDVRLYGHSGGGALAMLIAEYLPEVQRVVTLAGNLDTDAWIEHHGYSPLFTSMNPARRPVLTPTVERFHFMGRADTNIPPSLVSGWVRRQPNTTGVILDEFDHACCWQRYWPTVLNTLQAGPPYRWPGYRWSGEMIMPAVSQPVSESTLPRSVSTAGH